MKLAIFGIPGSGKSTQGNILAKQLKIPYLSTGHIFRALAREKSLQAKQIKTIIASGSLVPDRITAKIVKEYLNQRVYQHGFIIDGYPRTLVQAQSDLDFDYVIYLSLDDKEALWRLAGRHEDRDDDQLKIIKKRIELFHVETEEILEYYKKQNKLLEVNANASIEEINEQILALLGKEMVNNHLQKRQIDTHHLLLITGLPGSGKTEAVKYFQEKNIPLVSLSTVVNDQITSQNLPYTLASQEKVRTQLRSEHGMEALAKLSLTKIEDLLTKHELVVVDGYRSYEEFKYFHSKLAKAKITSLAILAPASLRDERIENRAEKKVYGRDRDVSEILGLNMGPSIALADYFIINDSTLEHFQGKLEEVYREIIFS